MVCSEGLAQTLQKRLEGLGRESCKSGEFTSFSFAAAREAVLWRAPSRIRSIISHYDTNRYISA